MTKPKPEWHWDDLPLVLIMAAGQSIVLGAVLGAVLGGPLFWAFGGTYLVGLMALGLPVAAVAWVGLTVAGLKPVEESEPLLVMTAGMSQH